MNNLNLLANLLFFIGLLGLYINRKHIIIILISLELLFLAINLNLVIYSVLLDSLIGQLYVLCILTVAAAEAAIGLSLLIIFYRVRGGISVDLVSLLKG
jgi:NADH:ubiquinone oxidoreductase subunit K